MFKNVASQSIALFAFDTTTGAPKTGDAANMLFYITKDWGTVTAIAANSGVPTEVDATNAKGWYKIAVSQTETNCDLALLTGKSATANISVVGLMVQTVPANFTTLSVDSNGRVDVIKIAGTTQTARDIGTSVLLSNGTGTGQLKLASGYVAMTWADVAAPTTAVDLSGTTIAVTQKVDVDTIKTNPVVNGGTVTFTTNSTVASTTNITAGTITTTTNLTNAPTNGDFTATMKTSIGTAVAASAVASVTGNVGGNVVGSVASVTAAVTLTSAYDFAKGTTAMTESYAAQGATMTPAQALYMINQFLGQHSTSSTTWTVKKRDGSSTAKTYTLDSATAPTSITEAT